mmetsp:Transcript_5300/g.9730  ORF Transcript_5300/g.9730 Transcript_5300/m.9730 type:complete len:362 (-) Transcript_5300:298-1383(-)|eukprot:CAMPEP_0183712708 /NCGR_PEP_ID=MMETSP0737-20130205/7778_1 /TAXON_ID=385413 /ORGANISM="Thalassiosira miniscula, Strain CCMP1093" /LENGTH=361 /DNA_ID=CAMNT_0025941377 /DNA_START=213 /DNA_END=1298 /DNA_ORIENTATION=+
MISGKYASLIAGCLQQTMLVLLIRYSKTVSSGGAGPSYLNSVAVASAEVFKLSLAFILEYITRNGENKPSEEGKIRHLRQMVKPMLIFNDKESAKLIVPALLYLIQNNLLFVALANLTVPVFQVTNQGKLLTTALLSRIMLKKQLSAMQYASVALLGFGVAFIHLSEYQAKEEDEPSEAIVSDQNQILGLIAVLVSCFTSGLSGVYFEFVLKKSPNKLSVHCRNFHLASWSFLLAGLQILFNDFEQIQQYGLFHGFDVFVVIVVVSQGMTGFIVSMMIKYADTVLKGFAISVAAVLATLLSVPLFGAEISSNFVAGAAMVGAAVKMYSHYGIKPVQSAQQSTTKPEGDVEEGVKLLPKTGS